MIKYILGLDLGTNSVGWALIQRNIEEKHSVMETKKNPTEYAGFKMF